jgi:S1-C subfamily serine protease
VVAGLVLWAVAGVTAVAAEKNWPDAADSVVKVFVTNHWPSASAPWSPGSTTNYQGSGVVLAGRRILTVAHLVARHTVVRVQRSGQVEKKTAHVLFISHEADLALLAVDEASFFDGMRPIELGPLPKKQQEVTVLGFPVGGDTLSITKGVVSRVEHQASSHSGASFLAIQVDAAVNAGSSGGPVIAEGGAVGIATQVLTNQQNTNYATPTPIINHFLEDVADGRYDGFPYLGVKTQTLESPALKRWLRLSEGETGVRVISIAPGSPASRVLRPDDVLLSVAGHTIADNGTVEFRPHERTDYSLYVDERQVGEHVPFVIRREGAERRVDVLLDWPWPCGSLVRPVEFEQRARYFTFGGLAFTTIDWNYLATRNPWPTAAFALVDLWAETPDEEPVVLMKVFASAVNRGYDNLYDRIITRVDGVKPRNLADLVRLVETGTGELVRFTDVEGQQIVLDRRQAAEEGPKILATYELPADRSAELEPRDYLRSRSEEAVAQAAHPISH